MPVALLSQIGGDGAYDFLSSTYGARSAAVGGYMIAAHDDEDALLLLQNPATLNKNMSNHLGITQHFHFAGIRQGAAAYAYSLDTSRLTLGIGAAYVDYGEFVRTSEARERLGTFSASENMITLTASYQSPNTSIGAALKTISSRLDGYSSFALATDLGVLHYDPERLSTWSIVLKNVGATLSDYASASNPLPVELMLGWSKRLRHVPLTLMITAHDVNRWHLDRANEVVRPTPENPRPQLNRFIDDFFRHLSFGGELIVGKREILRLRLGYDHRRNKELSNEIYRGFEGLNYGLGIALKRFQLDYGASNYHQAGTTHHLSLALDLNALFNRL